MNIKCCLGLIFGLLLFLSKNSFSDIDTDRWVFREPAGIGQTIIETEEELDSQNDSEFIADIEMPENSASTQ